MKRDPLPFVGGPDAAAATDRRVAWRRSLVVLAIALAAIVAACWDTGVAMVGVWWRSETFVHGFVVPPLALWLVWRQRKALAGAMPRPSPIWVLALVACGFAWLCGEFALVNVLSQFAFVGMLVASVPLVLGHAVAARIAFPLAFLFFAVPTGEFLLPTLMQWTADFTAVAVRASGVPVYREGLHLVIPTGRWSIVEACSGIRYLIASFMVGTLYAYLNFVSLRRRILFSAVALLIPILANWLRAYMIVMIGHLSDNRLAVGVDHVIYGWVFFGVVMLLMFWVGSFWHETRSPAMATPEGSTRDLALGAAPSPRLLGLVLAAALANAVAWPLVLHGGESGRVATSVELPPLPSTAAWVAGVDANVPWRPQLQGPSAVLDQGFASGARRVGLYVGYYRDQTPDRKLVSSSNALVRSDDPVWLRLGGGTRDLRVGDAAVTARDDELVTKSGQRLFVASWYWVDGRLTSNDFVAKAYGLLARLKGGGDDGAVVVVYALGEDGRPAAAAVETFVRDMGPALNATLRHAADRR